MAERKSVSMQDLADKLGISKVTVSKALNGKDGVGEELKEKIFALARESGYVLPDYGKRKSKKVGIIMSPRFSSGDEGKFYMAMYERIIYELQRASCSSIMISPTTATLPSDMNTIQTRGLFDGLIFLGILDKGVREQIAQIDLPKVYVDIYDRTHKSDSVITENIYSSYELTNYLIQQIPRSFNACTNLNAVASQLQTNAVGSFSGSKSGMAMPSSLRSGILHSFFGEIPSSSILRRYPRYRSEILVVLPTVPTNPMSVWPCCW